MPLRQDNMRSRTDVAGKQNDGTSVGHPIIDSSQQRDHGGVVGSCWIQVQFHVEACQLVIRVEYVGIQRALPVYVRSREYGYIKEHHKAPAERLISSRCVVSASSRMRASRVWPRPSRERPVECQPA